MADPSSILDAERYSHPHAWQASGLSGADLMRRLRWKRRREILRRILIGSAVAAETLLLLTALAPASEWGRLGESAGPIPATLVPLVAALFYLLPSVIGACCRLWQTAIVLATMPVWLDLGIFAVAASGRTGPFYLAQAANAGSVASTFELFVALGLFGWLASNALFGARGWRPVKLSSPIVDQSYHPGRVRK